MHIAIVQNTVIPVHAYGGTERIVWWLGKALHRMGHKVTFLAKKGSTCPFADVVEIQDKKPLAAQIPADCDLAHFHFEITEKPACPYIITLHGNCSESKTLDPNTVFISHNHATRHGGTVFVHNGIDLEDYGVPDLEARRFYVHFLGNAAWRVKNVQGAIDLAEKAGERLHVIGGTRVNFRMGLRITLNPSVRFHGMLGGDGKNAIINGSKGLIFPVLWHEPFGLAITESLYFGCPLFGTPYGSLPELMGKKNTAQAVPVGGSMDAFYSDYGFLSIKKSELVEAIKNAGDFNPRNCHEYTADNFSSEIMTRNYLKLYEQVIKGKPIHAEAPKVVLQPGPKFLPFGE